MLPQITSFPVVFFFFFRSFIIYFRLCVYLCIFINSFVSLWVLQWKLRVTNSRYLNLDNEAEYWQWFEINMLMMCLEPCLYF